MQKETLSKAMTAAYLLYPNLELNGGVLAAWFAVFKDEDGGLFKEALKLACKSSKAFFPTVGQVEEVITQLRTSGQTEHDRYPWITEAPQYTESKFELDGVTPTPEYAEWKSIEGKMRYRSIETKTGDVYLIQNPQAWETRAEGRRLIYIRLKPKFYLAAEQAKKLGWLAKFNLEGRK